MPEAAAAAAGAPRHPLALPHMRSLWLGSTISLLGDQFYLVALPWLVLQLTGSGLALGTVLMTTAVPRAVLMLAGGAVIDRFSARRVLIASALARTLLVGAVAALTWLGMVHLWHVLLLTFAFGVADAFSLPVSQAVIPTLVEPAQLGPANALMQGSTVMTQVIGPAPAGLIVRVWGLGAALLVDALSFLAVIAALLKIPEPARQAAAMPGAAPRRGMAHEIAEGLRAVRKDTPLMTLMGISAVLNLAIYGPIVVGIAAVAKFRFGSAAAFGTLLSFLSAGMLTGIVLGGRVKRPRHRGVQFAVMGGLAGLELIGIGLVMQFAPIAALLVLMGFGVGFVNVQFSAWVQTRVERALMGRVMSVMMFAGFGMVPVSYALAGALTQWRLAAPFL
ncbi:MAG TPA: MFS transporter, partial [Thermoanaerobaculia bacterium]|nr:MFS transporter [Thermoanaerobaculia bacterium]